MKRKTYKDTPPEVKWLVPLFAVMTVGAAAFLVLLLVVAFGAA